MIHVIISPKTGNRVLCVKVPANKKAYIDLGSGNLKDFQLNGEVGDMMNYVTLENYGKIQPITIRTHDKSRRTS